MSAPLLNFFFRTKKKLPVILQDERADCGHACIAMISNYWGHQLDLYTLRRFNTSSIRGITLAEIIELFENLRFMSRALQVPLEEMHLIKTPAILHWNMNHFVVLKKVTKNGVIIHDPARGSRKCSWEEASQFFTGIVLEVEQSNDFEEIRSQNKLSLWHLVKAITGINKYLIFLLLISFAIEILGLFNPLFIQYVTDTVLSMHEKNNLYAIAIGFFLLVLLKTFTEYTRGHMLIFLTKNLTEKFSANIVKHILKLPLDFFEKRSKGDLQSRFQSIHEIQRKLSTDFISTVLNGLMVLINLLVMYLYSPLLSNLALSFLIISVLIRYGSYHYFKKNSETSIQHHAKSTSLFLETLQAILPIKTFLKEKVRFSLWRASNIKSLNADIKIEKINVLYQVGDEFLAQIEHLLVICIGASLVLANHFSVGMLIAFLSYRLSFVTKSQNLVHNLMEYKLISIQLKRLSDILFEPPEILSQGSGIPAEVNGAITLKNVSFNYYPQQPAILHNINLHIKAGEKIAIVGPSGCGKTTLLKVMMGLLTASAGEIVVDDIPIKEFGLANFRKLTASVMQEDTLLSGSLLDNIVFFDEEIHFEKVYEAAKTAFIHEFISTLPMGYETIIGELGSSLSGGQKQRILLARALYRSPKILFLDEATSHLDSENEMNINRALKTLNITQIIIAHRKETIQMADRVIDLQTLNGN